MLFPPKGIDAIRALYHANPQDEEQRKHDIKLVGEQMCFDLGNRWGNKKRTGLDDTFRSADSISYLEDDSTVSVWDIQRSDGVIIVNAGDPPTFPNISPAEATFMECDPVNHMGGDNGEPPPPDGEVNEKLNQILANQEAIMIVQQEHTAMLQALADKVCEPFNINYPDYRGRVTFLGDTTFFPVPRKNDPNA